MSKEKFLQEVNRLKGTKTNLKAQKVALGSMDDMLGRAKDILSHAETEMPIRLRDWRSALSEVDDFGVEVSFEARMLEEDLDILAMKLEDLGLSPSDIGIYQDVMQIVDKLNTIQNEAHTEIGSGM